MLVVNLFGRPGAGKSTMAADIFAILKRKKIETELCMEYAKSLVWGERLNTLRDSLYVLAKQNSILRYPQLHGVSVAVTDSPLPIISVYRPDPYFESFDAIVKEVFDSYDNLNFYIAADHPYSRVGRLQTEHESLHVGEKILGLLDRWGVPFETFPANATSPEVIAKRIEEELLKRGGSAQAPLSDGRPETDHQ